MLFNRKPAPENSHDRLVDRLMECDIDGRRQVIMEALQRGDLRLSEADEVLHIVARLEALSSGGSSRAQAGYR